MKALEEYQIYKKLCSENYKPLRSYNAFCELRTFFKSRIENSVKSDEVFRICEHCHKEFKLTIWHSDHADVCTIEKCTHCGRKNDVWIRINTLKQESNTDNHLEPCKHEYLLIPSQAKLCKNCGNIETTTSIAIDNNVKEPRYKCDCCKKPLLSSNPNICAKCFMEGGV